VQPGDAEHGGVNAVAFQTAVAKDLPGLHPREDALDAGPDSTPWLVTGYAEQRAALADPRVSADASRPGYPSTVPLPPGGVKRSFIGMDDPEHARFRRMITAPFAVKRVEAMRSSTI
jgi:cytochrome P450